MSKYLVPAAVLGLIALDVFVFSACADSRTSQIRFNGGIYTPEEVFQNVKAAALADAAAHGNIAEIDRLIAEGADPNYVGRFEYTPLMWAVDAQSFAGFKRLIEKGGRLDIPNNTALSLMAMVAGPARSADFLAVALQHGGNPNFVDGATGETPIFQAVRSGDEKRVELLIGAGADVNHQSHCGTPLIVSALAAEYHSALILLKADADPKRRDCRGQDFYRYVSTERNIPWWMPSYWWQRRVLRYLERHHRNALTLRVGAESRWPRESESDHTDIPTHQVA